jgi:hypothetical protein
LRAIKYEQALIEDIAHLEAQIKQADAHNLADARNNWGVK